MIQTLEKVVDETSEIRLLEEVHLTENRRAIVIILDEEPKEAKTFEEENLRDESEVNS